ncbi:hypothetical protein TNCV_810071 [Trichonephila clavipes]|uniref:Pre-C2HC domain-containing protein n=1 Tax=Trichonephila clavipes TaxID=2585209 RepID=A0A8X6VII8_TRICX|nr:hypothetical protein TNCV_810071 [Trichonephila clavipes]
MHVKFVQGSKVLPWCGMVVRRGDVSSGVILVTWPWFKITRSITKSLQVAQSAHFNNLEDSGPVENENNPNGSKNSASQNAPQTQLPPPIMLFVEKNYKAQMAAITKTLPKIRSRLTGEFLKLYTDSAEERRMAVQHLTMLDFQFYAIKSKAERPIKVVIKGLPRNTNPEEIKQALEILGYTPDRVNQLIGRKNKRPLPHLFNHPPP